MGLRDLEASKAIFPSSNGSSSSLLSLDDGDDGDNTSFLSPALDLIVASFYFVLNRWMQRARKGFYKISLPLSQM